MFGEISGGVLGFVHIWRGMFVSYSSSFSVSLKVESYLSTERIELKFSLKIALVQ